MWQSVHLIKDQATSQVSMVDIHSYKLGPKPCDNDLLILIGH